MYDFLVGNYYDYIDAKMKGKSLPTPRGLRTIIESLNLKNLALVSYRTNISFRVGFEYELVRSMMKSEGMNVLEGGKTLLKTFKSYMVAFKIGSDTYKNIIKTTGYTDEYVTQIAEKAIKEIISGEQGFINSLNPILKSTSSNAFGRYKDFFVAETVLLPEKTS
jgi:hypothetical protein